MEISRIGYGRTKQQIFEMVKQILDKRKDRGKGLAEAGVVGGVVAGVVAGVTSNALQRRLFF